MEILGSLCFAFVFAFIVIAGVKGCAALLSSKPIEAAPPKQMILPTQNEYDDFSRELKKSPRCAGVFLARKMAVISVDAMIAGELPSDLNFGRAEKEAYLAKISEVVPALDEEGRELVWAAFEEAVSVEKKSRHNEMHLAESLRAFAKLPDMR